LPNAAAGAAAPMLQFESPASAGLSNFYKSYHIESRPTTGEGQTSGSGAYTAAA
jgi:hypothetical protein